MTESMTRPATGPKITRDDARVTYLSYWFVEGAEHGQAVLDKILEAWQGAAWPEGILTFSCYLSTDNDTVLTYAQCTNDSVYRPFLRSLPLPQGPACAAPVEYRLHRSVVADPSEQPGAMVAASFDVDGSERQQRIVASVVDNLENSPADERVGLIASHFHLSIDGSRVINFAEWVSDEDHVAFLEGATRHGSLRIATDMPGVRPIGYKRYHLYRSLVSRTS